MKHKSILFAVILMIFVDVAYASNYNININANTRALKTEKINNIDYVRFDVISKILFPKARISNNLIDLADNAQIKSAVGSFYVLFRSASDMKVAQMSLPAISLNNSMHVPIETFLNALHSLDIIKYDKTVGGLFVEVIGNFSDAKPTTQKSAGTAATQPNKSKIESSTVQLNVVAPEIKDTPKANIIDDTKSEQQITIPKQSDEPMQREAKTERIHEAEMPKEGRIPASKYSIPQSLDRSPVINK